MAGEQERGSAPEDEPVSQSLWHIFRMADDAGSELVSQRHPLRRPARGGVVKINS
jgi:hypothetical protein